LGQAIALDGSGNIYVGGFAGTDTNGRDGLLLRYTDTGAFSNAALFTGPAGGDDEILDIAVDSDGFIYAVGYETVTSQGENMWIRKYEYDTNNNEFNTIWTRTHDGGFGNDRAISVAISGSNLVVAGYETNSGGQTKLVLRVYAK
jgi:outer membrane protein assembly factor BamB